MVGVCTVDANANDKPSVLVYHAAPCRFTHSPGRSLSFHTHAHTLCVAKINSTKKKEKDIIINLRINQNDWRVKLDLVINKLLYNTKSTMPILSVPDWLNDYRKKHTHTHNFYFK